MRQIASDAYEVDSPEELQKKAEARGCVVVFPKANQLFIDIDTPEQGKYFDKCISSFQRHTPCMWVKRPSPSGKPDRLHITVTLVDKEIDERTRILYQAVLGSDPLREALSLENLENGDPRPTRFFEKK